MTKYLEPDLQGLRPLRDFGWEIRLQECTFKQNLDEFMEGVRARRGEPGKGKGSWGPKGKSTGGKESYGTGYGTAYSRYDDAPTAASNTAPPATTAPWGSYRPTSGMFWGQDDWLKPEEVKAEEERQKRADEGAKDKEKVKEHFNQDNVGDSWRGWRDYAGAGNMWRASTWSSWRGDAPGDGAGDAPPKAGGTPWL